MFPCALRRSGNFTPFHCGHFNIIFFSVTFFIVINLYLYNELFLPFIFISWRLITLQYCSGFCHTLTRISHGFACIPHPDPPSHFPLHPIPSGCCPKSHLTHRPISKLTTGHSTALQREEVQFHALEHRHKLP